jgi:protein-tyrosine phosphatase
VERHLPFERGVNFRDFGGYGTADGASVKWRKLFRCGALNKLTEDDLARIGDLQLAAVCDFRGPDECAEEPSRLPAALQPHIHQLAIEPGGEWTAEKDIVGLLAGHHTAAELSRRVTHIYKAIAIDFAPTYAQMFAHIRNAAGRPILIHCRGGKDRTGVGAALILSALGVPEDTILGDYMLSTQSVPLNLWLGGLLDHAATQHPLPRPRAEMLAEIMGVWGVSPDWLHTAFRAMHEQAGSIDAFLRETLGVSDAHRDSLRRWYLER